MCGSRRGMCMLVGILLVVVWFVGEGSGVKGEKRRDGRGEEGEEGREEEGEGDMRRREGKKSGSVSKLEGKKKVKEKMDERQKQHV